MVVGVPGFKCLRVGLIEYASIVIRTDYLFLYYSVLSQSVAPASVERNCWTDSIQHFEITALFVLNVLTSNLVIS